MCVSLFDSAQKLGRRGWCIVLRGRGCGVALFGNITDVELVEVLGHFAAIGEFWVHVFVVDLDHQVKESDLGSVCGGWRLGVGGWGLGVGLQVGVGSW